MLPLVSNTSLRRFIPKEDVSRDTEIPAMFPTPTRLAFDEVLVGGVFIRADITFGGRIAGLPPQGGLSEVPPPTIGEDNFLFVSSLPQQKPEILKLGPGRGISWNHVATSSRKLREMETTRLPVRELDAMGREASASLLNTSRPNYLNSIKELHGLLNVHHCFWRPCWGETGVAELGERVVRGWTKRAVGAIREGVETVEEGDTARKMPRMSKPDAIPSSCKIMAFGCDIEDVDVEPPLLSTLSSPFSLRLRAVQNLAENESEYYSWESAMAAEYAVNAVARSLCAGSSTEESARSTTSPGEMWPRPPLDLAREPSTSLSLRHNAPAKPSQILLSQILPRAMFTPPELKPLPLLPLWGAPNTIVEEYRGMYIHSDLDYPIPMTNSVSGIPHTHLKLLRVEAMPRLQWAVVQGELEPTFISMQVEQIPSQEPEFRHLLGLQRCGSGNSARPFHTVQEHTMLSMLRTEDTDVSSLQPIDMHSVEIAEPMQATTAATASLATLAAPRSLNNQSGSIGSPVDLATADFTFASRSCSPSQTNSRAQIPLQQQHRATSVDTARVYTLDSPSPSSACQSPPPSPEKSRDDSTNDAISELQVLVSEGLMEASSWLVRTLADNHGVICRDAPLEDPLGLIIDGHTGVVLLTPSMASSRNALKKVVKAMTNLAYKFRYLWVLNLQQQEQEDTSHTDTGFVWGLYQSLSQFPCRITLRHCTNESLAAQIAAVCYGAALEAKLTGVDISAYIHRPFFEALDRGAALNDSLYGIISTGSSCGSGDCAETSPSPVMNTPSSDAQTRPVLYQHCQFLQLLPTINFYVAAELLLCHSLPELASMTTAAVLKSAQLQLRYDPALQDMCALLQRHIGIRMRVPNVPSQMRQQRQQQQQYKENLQQQQRVGRQPVTVSPQEASRKLQPQSFHTTPTTHTSDFSTNCTPASAAIGVHQWY